MDTTCTRNSHDRVSRLNGMVLLEMVQASGSDNHRISLVHQRKGP